MFTAPETRRELRFACTQCGACCNRSPEVQLFEAAALSDVFVFRLMFRIYELPRTFAGSMAAHNPGTSSAEAFYESKRLLTAFAARSYPAKKRPGEKSLQRTKYLTISALTLDTGPRACAALENGRCGIYARRPLACRSVPFHYSRAEASAEADLADFVARPGYRCDTSAAAPVVLAGGRIVDPGARQARGEALEASERDRRWRDAILRRLRGGAADGLLPSLSEIEANAPYGTTTVSMRVAWQIAAKSGVIGATECHGLIAAQAAVIDRELAATRCGADARQTLLEMRSEYAQLLNERRFDESLGERGRIS